MQTDSCQDEYLRIFWVSMYVLKEQPKPGGQDTEGVLRATPHSAKPVVVKICCFRSIFWRLNGFSMCSSRANATLPLAPVSKPTFFSDLHIYICEAIVRVNKSQHLDTAVTLIIIEEGPRVFRFYNSEVLAIYGSYTVREIQFHLVATCYLFPLNFSLQSL